MLLGCIGDDFTGSSDLANTLAKGGMRVTQYCGVPSGSADPAVEAGIVALKSRTVPPEEAVSLSLKALDWLAEQGCRQYLFKYCSTFDSTPEGNIGPVIDALMKRLGADRTIVCPAFPETGRSVYQGHLFVADRLLSESGMRNHPLTPMTDADIRRWLSHQTLHAVGHVAAVTVMRGANAVAAAMESEVEAGRPVVVVDAIRNEDLMTIGRAAADLVLVTGGSGIALGLPGNFAERNLLAGGDGGWTAGTGPAAILSGSCSEMTRSQVARYREANPALELSPDELMAGRSNVEEVAAWAQARSASVPLIYTSADPAAVRAAQERHGRQELAACIEEFFAALARRLVGSGVSRLVVAGGETSGAVVEGLRLPAFDIGPEIAPGVPALKAVDRSLWLALKSGNFGDADFFSKAVAALGGGDRD